MNCFFFSYIITVSGSTFALKCLTYLFGEIKTKIPFTNNDFSLTGTMSHFVGMGLSFIFNYFTHKKFTFVETGLLDKIKDYNLTRFESATEGPASDKSLKDDVEWNTEVEIKLVPHPRSEYPDHVRPDRPSP